MTLVARLVLSRPMSPRARQILMLFLVAAFGFQTWLVYADPTGRTTPPLSAEAARGRGIWLANNCQSCHQIYGYGGFLGPDLTNATDSLTDARLSAILTQGGGVMPAFDLAEDERAAIARFLAEVDATGIGQLPPRVSFDAQEVLVGAIDSVTVASGALSRAELRGKNVMLEQKCIGCHLPNPRAAKKATDLTTLVGKLGRDGVKAIVRAGIAPKGMPTFDGLTDEDLDALTAFLAWLAQHEGVIHSRFAASAADASKATGLPWFEYQE
jgi:nitric oxide reductase subunit C